MGFIGTRRGQWRRTYLRRWHLNCKVSTHYPDHRRSRKSRQRDTQEQFCKITLYLKDFTLDIGLLLGSWVFFFYSMFPLLRLNDGASKCRILLLPVVTREETWLKKKRKRKETWLDTVIGVVSWIKHFRVKFQRWGIF